MQLFIVGSPSYSSVVVNDAQGRHGGKVNGTCCWEGEEGCVCERDRVKVVKEMVVG